jgi:hypothetical protein
MDVHNQPTAPWQADDKAQKQASDTFAPSQPAVIGTPTHRHDLSRRQITFGLLGVGAAGVAAAAAGVGIEQWLQHGGLNTIFHGPAASNVQIGHLLRRAGFGATSQDLQTYSSLGFAGAVDRLLNYQQVDDSDMENRLNALQLDLSNPRAQQQWWLLRMAWTQRPLLEKMTLFWHGHFTSSFNKVGGREALGRMIVQNQFLRTHAFDTFDNLLLGITADPAMLVYLDLTTSRKNAPNENYARELMELFTMGLGHYTQQDVSQGAAALTGWHVVGKTSSSHYLPNAHNNEVKTYLGHTGNLDYKDVVNILANHPATPWFISRKLFTFFVHENPSNNDLQPLVDAYTKNNHSMGAVMRTLLQMSQFTSDAAYRSRIKSPTEFVVGAYRSLDIQGNGAGLSAMTTTMGQTLFNPPNVAGWPADKVSALWLNSGTWMVRLNYIDQLLVGSRNRNVGYQPLDLQGIVNANHIDSPEHFVDYFASFLLDGQITQDRRTQLIDYFSTNSTSNVRVTLTSGKSYPLSSVRGTLYLMLASPEYQLN